jgi:predicted dehydrogenase
MGYICSIASSTLFLMSKKLLLVGFGPHGRRNYYSCLEKYALSHDIELVGLIELESEREYVQKYFKDRELKPRECIFVENSQRTATLLSPALKQKLESFFYRERPDGVIVATEPKSHKMYVEWAARHALPVLMDKPLTAPAGLARSYASASQIYQDFLDLKRISAEHTSHITVLCQRRYHEAYRYIKQYLMQFIAEFQIPISFIEIFHCDGNWNMPNEYSERENHPYKYGYGKLMHSGYHFVDALAWLMESNQQIEVGRSDKIDVYSKIFSPVDALHQIGLESYQHLFKDKNLGPKFKKYFSSRHQRSMRLYGELDSYNLLQFMQGERVVTTASINLLQNGFSRRAWSHLPADPYKHNGRLRHERVNIQVGPLLNIQLHSYESYESCKEQWPEEKRAEIGGDKHVEVYVFRNSQLIGGKSLDVQSFGASLTKQSLSTDLMRDARERCILEFIEQGMAPESCLSKHEMTNRLLSAIYTNITHLHHNCIPHTILQ